MSQRIPLPRPLIDMLEAQLAQSPQAVATLTGFYQGRNLRGELALHITGAELVVVQKPAAKAVQKRSRNGTVAR